MAEDEALKPFEQTVSNLGENSWEREIQTPEFQKISSDLEVLRKEILERKPMFVQSKEGPLQDRTYNVATGLLGAVRELFQSPDAVANPEKSNVINGSRNGFLLNLVDAM